jgi:hypothetical protein
MASPKGTAFNRKLTAASSSPRRGIFTILIPRLSPFAFRVAGLGAWGLGLGLPGSFDKDHGVPINFQI